MNKEKIENLIKKYDWYHSIELTPSVTTQGRYDWRPYLKKFNFPSLKGKKILDVGAGNGFFSFEFEKLGGIVTALEIPLQEERDNYLFGEKNIKIRDKTSQFDFQNPFYLAKKILNSQVKVVEKNVYKLTPENVGYYDIIFCNDVLLHLTDPIRALSVLRNICTDTIIIGTPIYIHKNKIIDFLIKKDSLSYFMGDTSGGAFWIPNLKCLESMLKSAGFTPEKSTIINLDKQHAECILPKGIITARIK